jgi:Ca2+-transporting ATPase
MAAEPGSLSATDNRSVPALPWHAMSIPDVLRAQAVVADEGLDAPEVLRRRERFGANRFAEAKAEPPWRIFLRQYRDLMQIVLFAAGVFSLWPLKEYETALVLIVITLFNAVLGMRQEGKAAAAVAALSRMMIVKAKVRRLGALEQIPAEELVPGDIVSVEAGDVVPADARIVSSASLEIDESALTGESAPVPKEVDPVTLPDTPLGDRVSMAYMNTNVTRGSATLVVTATGMDTEVGHISGMLHGQEEPKTPLTRQLDTLTNQILAIAGVALVVSMVLNISRGQSFTDVFEASIAFAIAAIPENLPAVVTAILSKGTQMLAAAGAIMKQLRSTETLGSTSAINSDKTGTLTLNQMTAVRLSLPGRRYSVSGTGYSIQGQITRVAGEPEVSLDPVLLPMVLASDAEVRDGEMVGDPTEGALVVLAAKGGVDPELTRGAYPRVAALPFDAAYKLMATFHRMKDDSGHEVVRCYVKGAPDQLLARATSFLNGSMEVEALTDSTGDRYLDENRQLGEQGLRVLATAYRDLDPGTFDPAGDLLALIDGLTLLAMVGIVDPPRPQAKAALATARAAGIRVRMITGDHVVTAQAIARELGIEGRAISGSEFAAMTDDDAMAAIGEIGVIARVTPEDKVRLVDLLKARGDIVAMTGDGVNDAPALKRADIGIAMGITGTEVSKEAAVMILTDDDFATIVKAVEFGRGLYESLTRYIRFQMGCLFGIILAFLGASIFNIANGVPFLPLQTLWINFTVILIQGIGLGFGTPSTHVMDRPPRRADAPVLSRGLLLWLAAIGVVMGATTLGVLCWGWGVHGEAVARTMGMTTFLVAILFLSLESRDQLVGAFSLDVGDDRAFLVATAVSIGVIYLGTTVGVFQRILGTTEMSLNQWLISIVAGASVIVATEIQKAVLRGRLPDRAERSA